MILERTSAGLCSSLILSEKLYPHLLEIDWAEQERMDAMLPRMMEAAGVTEELKAHDPIRWVGLMNTLKAQVEETIFQEIIFAWFENERQNKPDVHSLVIKFLYSLGNNPVVRWNCLEKLSARS